MTEPIIKSGIDWHYCFVCKKDVYGRLYQHVRNKHHMSNEEYAEKYKTEDWVPCPECGTFYFRSLKYRNSGSGKSTCGKQECLLTYKKKERENTCIDTYGETHHAKTQEYRKWMSEFSKDEELWKNFHKPARELGYENVSQVPEVKEQKILTCRENFSVDFPMQSPIVIEKSESTMLKRYGYRNNLQRPEIRELSNEAFHQWLESNDNNEEYWKNKGFISQSEDRFYNFLKTVFFEDDIQRQVTYRSVLFNKSFKVDFHIKSLDLWMQFDGIYYHCLERFSGFHSGKKKRDTQLNFLASIGELNLLRITDSNFELYEVNKISEPQFYCAHLKEWK